MPSPCPAPVAPHSPMAEASARHTRRQVVQQGLALATGAVWLPLQAQQTSTDFWALLRQGGCVLLMRHAETEPGIGDPPQFKLGDCSTQRNLSAAGRAQARYLGQVFARQGVRLDEVRSSAWCRCTDTAELAFGRYTVWSALNSFFRDDTGPEQTRAVQQTLKSLQTPHNWMLVTHQVNISALTGEFPAMGEVFLCQPRPQAGSDRLPLLARWIP